MIEETKDGFQRVVTELCQDGKGRILLVVASGWFFSIGVRYTYPTLLPYFQETFGISLSTASLVVSVLWVAYAIGQFPGGVLGDQYGEGNILVISSFLSVIGIAAVAVSPTLSVLIAGTIAFGIATALFGPTRVTIFTDLYSERSGTALGVTMAAGSIGNSLLPVLATLIAANASWRLGFGALVPVFIVLSIALWFLVPTRTSPPINDGNPLSVETVREIVRSTRSDGIPLVLLAHIVASFVNSGFLALYPTYLVTIKRLSPSMAATLYGIYFAFGFVVQPIAGTSRDYFGARKTMITLLGVYFVSLLLLPHLHGVVTLGALTIFLSSRNGVGVITNTFISTSLPEEVKGSGLGLLRTVWILIGATSPAIVGYFADIGYFEEAFFGLALLAGIAATLALFVPDQ